MINICPVRNENYNCFQAVVATLATYWGREYALMFSDQWGFQFEYPDGSHKYKIGDYLKPGWKGITKELLESHHGIEVTWHNDVNHSQAIQKLQEELPLNRPIAIYIDSYLCPWSPAFHKYHTDHLIIVIGMNEKSGELKCVDPYYSDTVKFLDESFYQGNIHKLCTFYLRKPVETKTNNWKELLHSCIPQPTEQKESKDAFMMMRLFADELERNLDIDFELEDNSEMLGAPLLRQLREVEIARYNFSFALNYMSQSFSETEIKMIARKIFEAGESWYRIRLMIMKLALTPNKSGHLAKIAQRIKELSEYEEDLANALLTICKKI